MYTPPEEKKRLDPVLIGVSSILCFILVFLFHGYILAMFASLIMAIFILLLIFMVMMIFVVFLAVPLYYVFIAKNPVEEYGSYTIGDAKGAEEDPGSNRGRI